MKKMVIGLMVLVMMVLMTMTAIAAGNPKGCDEYEVYSMIREWVKAIKGEKFEYIYLDENYVYHTYGIVNNSEIRKYANTDFTPEVMENIYYDCGKFGYDWDVKQASVELVGFKEGYNVYELTLKTDKIPLGTYCEIPYYKVDLIFMVNDDGTEEILEEALIKEIEMKEIEIKEIYIN